MRTAVVTSLASLAMFLPAASLQAQTDVDSLISEVLEETTETQETAPASSVAPTIAPPAVPTLLPQPQQAREPGLVRGDTVSNMQFPNAPVEHVLAFYEQLTGKQVIHDNTVQGQINIVVNRPISRQEAIQIIETALQINGFTLVPGPGDRIVKVGGPSKNARQFAIPIISDIADLPDSDQIVTFVFNLAYAEPSEVQQIAERYVAVTPGYTAFVALPKTQALMVTETASVIKMLGRLIDAIDQPPAEVISEFIPLERADAKEVVEKLTAMFEKPADNTSTQPQFPFLPPWAQPRAGQQAQQGGPNQPEGATTATVSGGITLSEDSLIIGKIKLTADERTNRIHVVTRPANIAFIRNLIAEFDAKIPYGEPTRRVLRYVAANDVLDAIVKAITERGMDVDTSNTITTQTTRTPRPASRSGGAGSSTTSTAGVEELEERDTDYAPEARTVGNTKIIADKRSNAIVVLGNEEAKRKIFRVLDEIDVRSPQVMLTAVIGELVLDEGEEFGVDYIYRLGRAIETSVTNSDGTVTINRSRPDHAFAGISRNNTGMSLTDIATLTSVTAFSGLPGGASAFIGATDSLDIIVTALSSTGKFRVTSRPMVFTSNNRKAIISSGQEIAIPGETISGFTGNGSDSLVTRSTTQYKEVALKLEVVPLINSDREVTLEIVQEVNNVSGSTVIGGNVVPTITKRKIKTAISVANEATIALGGLVQETTDKAKSGIPVLHKLPLVGPLFGYQKDTKKRTELVVLLRPTVTYDPVESSLMTEREQEKLNFPADLEASLDASATHVNENPAPVKKRATPAPTPRLRPATRY